MREVLKLHQIVMIAAILAMALAFHARAGTGTATYKGLELPPYRVLESDGDIELRAYAPHLVAEVDLDGTRGQSIRRGFRKLAGFLFGDNAEDMKMDMTAPVSQMVQPDGWTVRFVMPADLAEDAVPAPDNPDIRLRRTASERHLVLRFSGRATDRAIARQSERLMAEALRRGLQVNGALHYHFYDDPFTLPQNRRNEISVPVL